MGNKNFGDRDLIEKVLKALGQRLEDLPYDVEILVVGAVAGVVVGVFDPDRATLDCDVMDYKPADALGAVELAADEVGKELNLPPDWFNSKVQIRRDALPDGWEGRKVWLGTFGKLTVWAASRPDMIAMKVFAGREQDLADLIVAKVQSDEAEFVRQHLQTLPQKGTPADQIEDAIDVLDNLELNRP